MVQVNPKIDFKVSWWTGGETVHPSFNFLWLSVWQTLVIRVIEGMLLAEYLGYDHPILLKSKPFVFTCLQVKGRVDSLSWTWRKLRGRISEMVLCSLSHRLNGETTLSSLPQKKRAKIFLSRWWAFPCLLSLAFPVQTFPAPHLGYMRQKRKPRELTLVLCLGFPGPERVCLLSIFQSLLVFAYT